jgi:hypothetical protein
MMSYDEMITLLAESASIEINRNSLGSVKINGAQ